MILTADIGNANIKIGLFNTDGKLIHSFKMGTDIKRTGDEYVSMLLQLMSHAGLDKSSVTGIAVSSIVPQLCDTFSHALKKTFDKKIITVGFGTRTGIVCKYEAQREAATDRIVNCVAAVKEYGTPIILVEFGTLTTYSVVNERGEFIGGAITLGIKSTLESIAEYSATLPSVQMRVLHNTVAQCAVQNIQSGVIFGAVGQTKYIIERIKREMCFHDVKVIATGELSDIVNEVEPIFDYTDRELSLKGLYEIYKLNA